MKKFMKAFKNKMSKITFIRITVDIFYEAYYEVLDVVGNNLRNVVRILKLGLPYYMYYIGIKLYQERNGFFIGGEIFIPLLVFLVTHYIKQYANRIGKGERVHVPDKRFTEPGEEIGEYTVETRRIDEMIVYMSKLEDWLERKGFLR